MATKQRNDGIVTKEELEATQFESPLSAAEIADIMAMNFDDLATQSTPSNQVFAKPEMVEKDDLVGQPIIILSWAFNDGDYGRGKFVSVTCMTKANELVLFNDGSTGIFDQLEQYTDKHKSQRGPILCRKGLTRSDYWRGEDSGDIYKRKPSEDVGEKVEPAHTFYLS